MKSSKPPAAAMWLLEHLMPGGKNEALTGDLLEEFKKRQSSTWYWHQVLLAIMVRFAAELRRQPLTIALAVPWTFAAQLLYWQLLIIPRLHSLFWWWIRLVWPVSLVYQIGLKTALDGFMLLMALVLYLAVTRGFNLQNLARRTLIGMIVVAMGNFSWWMLLPLTNHPSRFSIVTSGGLPLFVGLLVSICATGPRTERREAARVPA